MPIKVKVAFSVEPDVIDEYDINYLERNGVDVKLVSPNYDSELVLEGPSDVIKEFVEEYYETEMGEFVEFRELIFDPRLNVQINDNYCVEYWRDEDDPDSAVINPTVKELVYRIF